MPTQNINNQFENKRKTEAELVEIREKMVLNGLNNRKTIDFDKRHGIIDR